MAQPANCEELSRRRKTSPGARRTRRVAPALLALSLLGACASTEMVIRWEKPGGTQDELEAAQADCRARQEARRNQRDVSRQLEPELRKYYYNQCMNEHGWSSVQEKVER